MPCGNYSEGEKLVMLKVSEDNSLNDIQQMPGLNIWGIPV
jgi:hypothetical protein